MNDSHASLYLHLHGAEWHVWSTLHTFYVCRRFLRRLHRHTFYGAMNATIITHTLSLFKLVTYHHFYNILKYIKYWQYLDVSSCVHSFFLRTCVQHNGQKTICTPKRTCCDCEFANPRTVNIFQHVCFLSPCLICMYIR